MNRPARLLLRHFLLGFSQVEAVGSEGRLSAAGALGVLALPGAIVSLLFYQKYSPLFHYAKQQLNFSIHVESLTDKYAWIVFSMAISALVPVLRWDTLFPDRRDYANLAPMPVPLHVILLAKGAALTLFVCAFILDVNMAPAVIYPAVALGSGGTVPDLLRWMTAHAAATCSAGLCAFALVLAVSGLMMAALPYGLFRRCKRFAQFAFVVIILLFFALTPTVSPEIARLRTGGTSWAEWLPSIWFLGLYQQIQGVSAGELQSLAPRALMAAAACVAVALLAYGLSYRRFFLKSAEKSEGPSGVLRVPAVLFQIADRWLLRTGFERACFRFIVKTILRSDRHTTPIAATFGIGTAVAILLVPVNARAAPGFSSLAVASLILVYSAITGLRLSFGIPADPRSTWSLRVPADPAADPLSLVRKVFAFCIAPLVFLSAAAFAIVAGWTSAALHVLYAVAASALLIELAIMGFRIIPFTCPWLPGSGNIVFALAAWVAGLVAFGQGLGAIEAFALTRPGTYATMMIILIAATVTLRRFKAEREPIVWADSRGQLDLLRLGE